MALIIWKTMQPIHFSTKSNLFDIIELLVDAMLLGQCVIQVILLVKVSSSTPIVSSIYSEKIYCMDVVVDDPLWRFNKISAVVNVVEESVANVLFGTRKIVCWSRRICLSFLKVSYNLFLLRHQVDEKNQLPLKAWRLSFASLEIAFLMVLVDGVISLMSKSTSGGRHLPTSGIAFANICIPFFNANVKGRVSSDYDLAASSRTLPFNRSSIFPMQFTRPSLSHSTANVFWVRICQFSCRMCTDQL